MKEKNPEIIEADIKTQISENWSNIKGEEEKVFKYKQMADDDKKRYEEFSEDTNVSKKTKKKRKDKNTPKKGLSAYILFGIDERKKI